MNYYDVSALVKDTNKHYSLIIHIIYIKSFSRYFSNI